MEQEQQSFKTCSSVQYLFNFLSNFFVELFSPAFCYITLTLSFALTEQGLPSVDSWEGRPGVSEQGTGGLGSIPTAFSEQLSQAQIPKAQKLQSSCQSFLHFWDLLV